MCPHEEKVTAWLLGDLPPDEAQAMTRHLEACAECRAVRDDCAGVLAPLRSALARDICVEGRAGSPLPAAEPCRAPRSRAATRGLAALPREWLRRAALLAVSLGMLGVLLAVAYRQTGRGRGADGNVTHITLLRGDGKGVPPLDALPEEAKDAPPVLAGLLEGRLLETDGQAMEIGTGISPVAAEPPHFRGFLKSEDVARANKAVPQMRPVAAKETVPPAERLAEIRRGSKSGDSGSPAYPQAKPIMLGGASLALPAETNSAATTNNVSVTNAPGQTAHP